MEREAVARRPTLSAPCPGGRCWSVGRLREVYTSHGWLCTLVTAVFMAAIPATSSAEGIVLPASQGPRLRQSRRQTAAVQASTMLARNLLASAELTTYETVIKKPMNHKQ